MSYIYFVVSLLLADENECVSGPCQHGGNCVDLFDAYSCQCAPGWDGVNCEINFNECQSSPCDNGGTCRDEVNRYSCDCLPGYDGSTCKGSKSKTLSPTHSNMLKNVSHSWDAKLFDLVVHLAECFILSTK